MPPVKTVNMPDGKGGWKMVPADSISAGNHSVDPAKRNEAEQKTFLAGAVAHMNKLVQFDQQLCIDMGVSKEQRACAAALYAINIRATYPGKDGKPDPAAFDDLAAGMQEEYEKEHK
jgi:hypothetical protein